VVDAFCFFLFDFKSVPAVPVFEEPLLTVDVLFVLDISLPHLLKLLVIFFAGICGFSQPGREGIFLQFPALTTFTPSLALKSGNVAFLL